MKKYCIALLFLFCHSSSLRSDDRIVGAALFGTSAIAFGALHRHNQKPVDPATQIIRDIQQQQAQQDLAQVRTKLSHEPKKQIYSKDTDTIIKKQKQEPVNYLDLAIFNKSQLQKKPSQVVECQSPATVATISPNISNNSLSNSEMLPAIESSSNSSASSSCCTTPSRTIFNMPAARNHSFADDDYEVIEAPQPGLPFDLQYQLSEFVSTQPKILGTGTPEETTRTAQIQSEMMQRAMAYAQDNDIQDDSELMETALAFSQKKLISNQALINNNLTEVIAGSNRRSINPINPLYDQIHTARNIFANFSNYTTNNVPSNFAGYEELDPSIQQLLLGIMKERLKMQDIDQLAQDYIDQCNSSSCSR
jgi:hypothetical protein